MCFSLLLFIFLILFETFEIQRYQITNVAFCLPMLLFSSLHFYEHIMAYDCYKQTPTVHFGLPICSTCLTTNFQRTVFEILDNG